MCGLPSMMMFGCAMQGMLSIGAALMGAAHVLAVDVDAGALQLCQENVSALDCPMVCNGTCFSLPAFSELHIWTEPDETCTQPCYDTR